MLGPLQGQWWPRLESGGCFTNVSQVLPNNVAKIYNARNHIYGENFKLKLCTCVQSMALGTRTEFQLEILIRNMISAKLKFFMNILESSWNLRTVYIWDQHLHLVNLRLPVGEMGGARVKQCGTLLWRVGGWRGGPHGLSSSTSAAWYCHSKVSKWWDLLVSVEKNVYTINILCIYWSLNGPYPLGCFNVKKVFLPSVAYRYRKSISNIELFVSIILIYIGFLATNF